MTSTKARKLLVRGRVQGVGFRPSVYRLATKLGLAGSVCNTAEGVVIELEGPQTAIEAFCHALPGGVPSLARVTGIEAQELSPRGREEFSILPSESTRAGATALVPFDVAACVECMREVRDPEDRRHRYPFTNCTLCGPRYTIIESVPYDRPRTSMKVFPMCPECGAEYADPGDRRYHAQPNACATCGPSLTLLVGGTRREEDALGGARRLLQQGNILAVRGVGGFHLAVDATRTEWVERLRRRKGRGKKPFAVMAPDVKAIRAFARIDALEERLLRSERCPIVLLDRGPPGPLSEAVAPGNARVGAMLPYSPLHHLLAEGFEALVMTSGNLAEEPIARDNDEAVQRLSGVADGFLLHDRDILMSCDDSVVYRRGEAGAFVRRSRGYAPDPVPFGMDRTGILAVGAHMKNTFCLTRGAEAFLSQHIGDLENEITHEHFLRCLDHLENLLGVRPEVVACDLHPDYLSTRHALAIEGVRVERVQHHHAHLAACMADNDLEGEVIGLCLDGTGLGEDGTVWGGELLVGGFGGYRRAGRLRPFPLPGGDAAVREPWRTAAGWLLSTLGENAARERVGGLAGVPADRVAPVVQAAVRQVNTPWTSSLGRLFDAASATLSICTRVDYDGQAAVELETEAGVLAASGWRLPVGESEGMLELDHVPLAEGLLRGLESGVPRSELAAGFHASIVEGLAEMCTRVRDRGGPERVVLSGGCMLNRRLDQGLEDALTRRGFRVYGHRRVPANDGGLCLGQAAVAARRGRG